MKQLASFFVLLLIVSGVWAQSFTVEPNDSVFATITPRGEAHLTIYFQNTSGANQRLRWNVPSASAPSAWIIQVCDNFSCHNAPHPQVDSMMTVAPLDSGFLKATFIPDEVPGSGWIKCVVWDVADSVGTAVEVYFAVDALPNAVAPSLQEEAFTLSPSPAASNVHLSAKNGLLEKGNIQVFDIAGQQVLTQSTAKVQTATLNVSDLVPGIYLLRYESKAGILTKKLVIAR